MSLTYEPINGESWIWIKRRLPVLAVEDSCGIVAVKTGRIYVGACVMDNWTANSVQCSFVVENPLVLREGFLRMCCSYVFEECGKKKAYAQVASNNVKSLKFVKHIGFVEQCVLKDVYGDGIHCVILELVKENCNYLLEEVA